VTGVLTDVPKLAGILCDAGWYCFLDYAGAGPYVPINMHGPGYDVHAVFLSVHKFIGGPAASGVLIAHKCLFRTDIPHYPGGGTVAFVAPGTLEDKPELRGRSKVLYDEDLQAREEGGTPAIMNDIRAGVAFTVKVFISIT